MDGSGRRLEHRTLDGTAEVSEEVAPGLLDVAGRLHRGAVGDASQEGRFDGGRQVEAVEQRGGGRALDGTQLAGDDDTGDRGLVLDVEVDVGVLGDPDLELRDLREAERVVQAGGAEDEVGDVRALAQRVEVDARVLLGALALLGLGVAAVAHGTADRDLVVVVARSDHLVVGVERGREGVEVDRAASQESAGLGTPGDVEPLGAGDGQVLRAHLVEVEHGVERVLLHVDRAVVSGTEHSVHDLFLLSHM